MYTNKRKTEQNTHQERPNVFKEHNNVDQEFVFTGYRIFELFLYTFHSLFWLLFFWCYAAT